MVAARRRIALLLGITLHLSAASALAQPLTMIVETDQHDVLGLGDFNQDGRLDVVTLENEFGDHRLAIRDAQTGRLYAKSGSHPMTSSSMQLFLMDMDLDGNLDILMHDAGLILDFEVPSGPVPCVGCTPYALNPQWWFSWPSFPGPPSSGFSPLFATLDGLNLHLIHLDHDGGQLVYRVRDGAGAILQTIPEPMPNSRADVWDVNNDGKSELVLLGDRNNSPSMVIWQWTAPVVTAPDAAPGTPALRLLGSNPARGMSLLSYSVPSASEVDLVVHDVQGRAVRTLARGRADAGTHELRWGGDDDHGRPVPSGMYYVHLTVDGSKLGRKAVVYLR